MRRLLYILPAALFVLLAAYFAAGLMRGEASRTLPSALIDRPAPAFTLAGLGGRPGLATADLAGKPALVNFFASWCAPCRIEHPLLMRLAAEGKVPLYGIAYKDKPEEAERLLAQQGDPYAKIGVDPQGRTAIDFGVYGVPETYVVDATGRVRYRYVGPITEEAWREKLQPLLRQLGAS